MVLWYVRTICSEMSLSESQIRFCHPVNIKRGQLDTNCCEAADKRFIFSICRCAQNTYVVLHLTLSGIKITQQNEQPLSNYNIILLSLILGLWSETQCHCHSVRAYCHCVSDISVSISKYQYILV